MVLKSFDPVSHRLKFFAEDLEKYCPIIGFEFFKGSSFN